VGAGRRLHGRNTVRGGGAESSGPSSNIGVGGLDLLYAEEAGNLQLDSRPAGRSNRARLYTITRCPPA